jgi:hypothetical protein
VQAIDAKLRAQSGRDARGHPTKDRVSDARLSFEIDQKNHGLVIATVTALERRMNPYNPDPEWHHVAPNAAEVAAVRSALGLR